MWSLLVDTWTYYRSVWYYLRGGEYEKSEEKLFRGYEEAVRIKVFVFSMCLALRLWDEPHYRKSSYAADVRDNFRNVAIPGTGIPLSVVASHKAVGYWFVLCAYPVVCLVAGLADARRRGRLVSVSYREQLLAPRDWFSLWRINSRLSAYHSLATYNKDAPCCWHDYEMENKWKFLEKGLKLGVAVSPIMEHRKLCVKHKNEEGGMGIHFFNNALGGGDWIIQEVMDNADDLAKLLPEEAPLSTFRVMTASNLGRQDLKGGDVFPLSCVFRAGRSGAATDHSSVLFDVDLKTGTVKTGTTNANWYKLGRVDVPWGPPPPILKHPDAPFPTVAGQPIADFEKRVLNVALDAHRKLIPRVPIAGWDVVLSKQHGPCLLEVNLSCNFFRGSFDADKYFNFVDKCFLDCQRKKPLL